MLRGGSTGRRNRRVAAKKSLLEAMKSAGRKAPPIEYLTQGGFGDIFASGRRRVFKVVSFTDRYPASRFRSEAELAAAAGRKGFGPEVLGWFSTARIGVLEIERWHGDLEDIPAREIPGAMAPLLKALPAQLRKMAGHAGLCADVRLVNILFKRRPWRFTLNDFDVDQCASLRGLERSYGKKQGVKNGVAAVLMAQAGINVTAWLRQHLSPRWGSTLREIFPELYGGAHEVVPLAFLGEARRLRRREGVEPFLKWFWHSDAWHWMSGKVARLHPIQARTTRTSRRRVWTRPQVTKAYQRLYFS